jgi:hypothetical protein
MATNVASKLSFFRSKAIYCTPKIPKSFVGKREHTVVIDLVLQKMSRGNEATIVAPWYLAYGTKGNGHNIIGFTSLIIKLKVEEEAP